MRISELFCCHLTFILYHCINRHLPRNILEDVFRQQPKIWLLSWKVAGASSGAPCCTFRVVTVAVVVCEGFPVAGLNSSMTIILSWKISACSSWWRPPGVWEWRCISSVRLEQIYRAVSRAIWKSWSRVDFPVLCTEVSPWREEIHMWTPAVVIPSSRLR